MKVRRMFEKVSVSVAMPLIWSIGGFSWVVYVLIVVILTCFEHSETGIAHCYSGIVVPFRFPPLWAE